jgi:hypothetical protein
MSHVIIFVMPCRCKKHTLIIYDFHAPVGIVFSYHRKTVFQEVKDFLLKEKHLYKSIEQILVNNKQQEGDDLVPLWSMKLACRMDTLHVKGELSRGGCKRYVSFLENRNSSQEEILTNMKHWLKMSRKSKISKEVKSKPRHMSVYKMIRLLQQGSGQEVEISLLKINNARSTCESTCESSKSVGQNTDIFLHSNMELETRKKQKEQKEQKLTFNRGDEEMLVKRMKTKRRPMVTPMATPIGTLNATPTIASEPNGHVTIPNLPNGFPLYLVETQPFRIWASLDENIIKSKGLAERFNNMLRYTSLKSGDHNKKGIKRLVHPSLGTNRTNCTMFELCLSKTRERPFAKLQSLSEVLNNSERDNVSYNVNQWKENFTSDDHFLIFTDVAQHDNLSRRVREVAKSYTNSHRRNKWLNKDRFL